jgi:hypothetical protein
MRSSIQTTWLDQSGWVLDSTTITKYRAVARGSISAKRTLATIRSATQALPNNDYYTNEVTPLSDGRVAYSYSADAYSACSSALTFGREKNA